MINGLCLPLILTKKAIGDKDEVSTTQLQINGLVQGRRNSSALAMELRLSCNNPSK